MDQHQNSSESQENPLEQIDSEIIAVVSHFSDIPASKLRKWPGINMLVAAVMLVIVIGFGGGVIHLSEST